MNEAKHKLDLNSTQVVLLLCFNWRFRHVQG
jgi:hypothetical protein